MLVYVRAQFDGVKCQSSDVTRLAPQQMSPPGLAVGGCACSTHSVLFATATPCEPAEGEQAFPQPHPGVPRQLQDFQSVLGKC